MHEHRVQLLSQRTSTVAQIADLSRVFDSIVDAAALVATDDEHDPEGATIAFERQQVAALLASSRQRLVDIDRALGRLDSGEHGRCERCGGPIGAERLAFRPTSTRCVTCAAVVRE